MPQLLEVLQRGDRVNPTLIKFGASEVLAIHADGNADICDRVTGATIRPVGWNGIKEMGYCPHKLMNGNRADQALDMPYQETIADRVRSFIGATGLITGLTVAFLTVSHFTGCTAAIGGQLDKDMATSTTYPRINAQDEVAAKNLAEFRKQNQHANKVLASARQQAAISGGAL